MTDTDLASTPAGSPAPSPVTSRPAVNRRSVLLLVSGAVAVVLAAVIALIPAPYAIYGPGPVTNVLGSVGTNRLISISGAKTYRPGGQLDMTTVEVFGGPGRRLGLPQVLWAWVSRERAVVPEEQVFPPGRTQAQVETENAAEMSGSQETATAAGLREAGLTVPESIAITEVSATAPAAKVLRVGDVVTGIDGRPVADSTELRARIAARTPGQQLRVQVRRGGTATTVTTTTYEQGGRTVLGVGLDPTFRFPVEVDFAAGDVGGPSAGMMFALGIYDLLTPGDLTGGKQIAGTGTIDANGTVGPIGGIAQKLVGARAAGAAWFIAPASNCDEVVGNVPDGLRVVRTGTLHESRTSIAAIAGGRGDSLPTCS